jgi:leader peptidase (prepilin peptidase)/N-methyltransferase
MTPSTLATVAEFAAFGGLAVLSVALAVVDLRTHRLPDRLVLPAYPAAVILLGGAALLRGEPLRLISVAGGALALFAFYLGLRMLRAGGMGGGDVKLAGLLGAYLGYLGWDAVLAGALAGFLFGGVFAAALLLTRRARAGTAVAFGPWMLLGAWAAILAFAGTHAR